LFCYQLFIFLPFDNVRSDVGFIFPISLTCELPIVAGVCGANVPYPTYPPTIYKNVACAMRTARCAVCFILCIAVFLLFVRMAHATYIVLM